MLKVRYLSNQDPLTCYEKDPEPSPFNVKDLSGFGENRLLWKEKIPEPISGINISDHISQSLIQNFLVKNT
jgi:hypothetical protein